LGVLYLIDGYNLLYALGVLLKGRTGPKVLQKARRFLLNLLHDRCEDATTTVTVVFDAKQAPPGLPDEVDDRGIHVVFAVHEEEADDLIEQLIRQAAVPHQLTVVSDDHRIREAGRRRQCVVQTCGDFLDFLDRQHRRRPTAPHAEPVKPEGVSREETQRWLREFADLADDPGMKELFDPPWSTGGEEDGETR
jgi:predicted RNA-binding protein with PIN domain